LAPLDRDWRDGHRRDGDVFHILGSRDLTPKVEARKIWQKGTILDLARGKESSRRFRLMSLKPGREKSSH
jgi:hypothetical protein